MRGAVEKAVGALYVELHHAPPPAPLDPHCRLDADLGLDSLARVELVGRLEHELGIEIREEALGALDTLGDLLSAVRAAPGARAMGVARVTAMPPALQRSAAAPPSGAPEEAQTLPEVLAWRVARQPQAEHAVVIGNGEPRVLDYAALLSGAEAVASGLRRHGISPGATVALMLPTSVDYLHAFFGVLLAGAIPVPLYPPAHRAQLQEHVRRHTEILVNAGAEALITFGAARPVGRWLKSRVHELRQVLSVGELARPIEAPPRAPRPSGPSGPSGPSALAADSIALLQYTSGSTGSPKGVVLTHRQLLANIRAMGASIGASDADVFVSWLPLYHDMGLIGAWLGSLYFGCLLVLMPPTAFLARPVRWLRAIHDFRGTLSASPNFGYELAARRTTDEELRGLDLSCLRVAFNGAEPVHPQTLDRFRRRFEPYGFRSQAMTPVYGLAESGVGLTFPPTGRGPLVDRIDRELLAGRGEARPKPGRPGVEETADAMMFTSSGMPLPGYRLRVVDERGLEVPERTEGDLQFAGPSATSGYFHNPAATARLVAGEWRNTGDRAYLAAGELYITGRAKDIIIRRGRHYYPEEIEAVAATVEGIRRGCVTAFGTTDAPTGTEKLIVVAETRETDARRRGELERRITQALSDSIGDPPDEIILVEPHVVLKTSSGKLRRAATRQALLDGSLGRSRGPRLQVARLALESAILGGRRRVGSLASVAFGLYAWCVLGALAVPALLIAMLLRGPAAIWHMNHRAARGALWLLGMPVAVTGSEPLEPRSPHVIVANHSSYADGVFLCAVLREPHRFVAKSELERAPLLGRWLRRLGTVFIARFVPERSASEVGRVRETLGRGDSVIMFPEGTFTAETGLRGFHLGAFQAAVAARAPVVPLALRGTRSVLRGGRWLPRRAQVSAVIGAPLAARPDEEPFAAAVRLRDAARAHILRSCGEPDLA